MTRGISIFIPALNEEELLVENTGRLIRFLERLGTPYEIIIGSNGSVDHTALIGRLLAESFAMVRFFHIPEKGAGSAFKEAVSLCRHDRIITVDADLSIDLSFIKRAAELLDENDIVVGSKISGNQKRSIFRRAASWLFVFCTGILLNLKFDDYSIGAKGYRKKVVSASSGLIDRHTFYVVAILFKAKSEGRRIVQVPVDCMDMRGSRFNLLFEGIYRFSSLFLLWSKSRIFKAF